MKSIATYSSLLVMIFGTLASGWLHGHMTNRWAAQAAQEAAESRLRRALPDRIGNWQLRFEEKLPDSALQMLECSSYIHRSYVNDQTGHTATVAVLVGPAGPIAVHTPEICYSSRDFSITNQRNITEVVDADGHAHSLWETKLRSNQLDAASLRVYYGWSTGTAWDATDRPRFAFAGAPYLYKLQLSVSDSFDSKPDEFNPGLDFLTQFIPHCQSRMIDPRSPAP